MSYRNKLSKKEKPCDNMVIITKYLLVEIFITPG